MGGSGRPLLLSRGPQAFFYIYRRSPHVNKAFIDVSYGLRV